MNEHDEFIKKNYPDYPKPFIVMGVWVFGWLLLGAAAIAIITLWAQLIP